MLQRIVVAIDESEISRRAFEQALALAQATNARLLLVHVLSPVNEAYPHPVFPGPDSVYPSIYAEARQIYTRSWKAYEQQGLDLLRHYADLGQPAGIAIEYTQPLGDAGSVICNLAHTWSADLIVLGRRGRSSLSELFLGSVSNYVNHHAPCSVLTVQTEQPRPQPGVAELTVTSK